MSHANRGMQLEKLIDRTNKLYKKEGFADIRKVPTPVKILKREGHMITGYTQKGEWVDYSGVVEGRAIVFDAKQTQSRTSFPLSNVTDQQYDFLKSWHEKKAVSFILISFVELKEVYILPFISLKKYWEAAKEGGRKSIPITFFSDNCDTVELTQHKTLDYLKSVIMRGWRDEE